MSLRAVEFFSGIGGWHYALKSCGTTCTTSPIMPSTSTVVAAFDINEDANIAYHHNIHMLPSNRNLETITAKSLDAYTADLFMMSPPCQPFTRSNKSEFKDDKDPRAKAFLNIIKQLPLMKNPPTYIAMENVIGFELSECCKQFLTMIDSNGYVYNQFALTPAQFGIPNDRPRYFCIARKRDESKSSTNDPSLILTTFPGDNEQKKIQNTSLSKYIDRTLNPEELLKLKIPDDILEKSAAWCFDIVSEQDTRSSCFTKAYSKFIKGSGSILLLPHDEMDRADNTYSLTYLKDPSERVYDDSWRSQLEGRKLRYFSPHELALLFGFPSEFEFPPSLSNKKCFELIGNSLNVAVAQRLLEYLFDEANLL